jgi:hypothetical protein
MQVTSFDAGTAATSEARREAFAALGWREQRADPARIPESPASVVAQLGAGHPFYAHGSARAFLVERGGEVVARCLAIANEHARDEAGRQVGYVGFWESRDDSGAARAVLDAACDWLRTAHDVRQVVGPMNFSTWYSYRLSDPATHDRPSLWLEPRTAPHAPALWQAAGFAPAHGYCSMDFDAADQPAPSKLAAIQAAGYTTRAADLDRWDQELRLVFELSLAGFAGNLHYTPVTWEEFVPMYDGVQRIVDPRLVRFVVSPEGEEVAFLFAIPNYARAALAMNGRSGLLGKLAFRRNMRHADTVLLKTVATLPAHRAKGLGNLLTKEVVDAGAAGGRRRMAWMLMHDDNHSTAMAAAAKAGVARRYVLYEREL